MASTFWPPKDVRLVLPPPHISREQRLLAGSSPEREAKQTQKPKKGSEDMAKEHPALRDCFEDLLEFFDGKRVLTQSDICHYTGRTPKWVKAHYGVGDHKAIGTKAFARMLCEPN